MAIRLLLSAALAALFVVPAGAAEFQPLAGPPPEPIVGQPMVGQPIPYASPGPPVVVQPAIPVSERNIRYVSHRKLLFPARGGAPVDSVLLVEDPLKCDCLVAIPVCLPVHCTGKPIVRSRVGLLGRGNVTYVYSNGYRLKIVFEKCGDVTVHTFS